MYRFDRALQANGSAEPMIFDVAANWTVVKSLLTCPGNGVQILFIARWLRHALLRYARAIKEPSRVIALARQFLRQPSRSSAHADHLHVRIGCAHDDLAEGCLTSARQTASSYATPHVQKRLPVLRRALGSEQAKRRAGAVYLLSLFADKRSLPQLRGVLDDPNFEVRGRAVDAIAKLDPKGAAEVIDRVLERESNAHVALIQMRALARLRATEFLAWRLRDPRVLPGDGVTVPEVMVRKVALELLAESDSLAAAGMVVPLLSDPVSAVRNQAHDTLGRIVNRSTADLVLQSAIRDMANDDIDERTPASLQWPLTPDDHVALWTRFLATIPASASRRDVALEGFQQRGLPIRTLSRRQLSYLATALSWESPYCHNAARLIARLVRYQPEVGRGAHSDPRGFWMPWLMRRKLIDPHLMAVTMRLHQDVVAELIADP
jgi:hypothetical protein